MLKIRNSGANFATTCLLARTLLGGKLYPFFILDRNYDRSLTLLHPDMKMMVVQSALISHPEDQRTSPSPGTRKHSASTALCSAVTRYSQTWLRTTHRCDQITTITEYPLTFLLSRISCQKPHQSCGAKHLVFPKTTVSCIVFLLIFPF